MKTLIDAQFDASDLRDWLLKVSKWREHLITSGKSFKKGNHCTAVVKLQSWLSAYPKADFFGISRFILTKVDYIETILPGRGSTCYDKFWAEWHAIHAQCLVTEICRSLNIQVNAPSCESLDILSLTQLREEVERYRNQIRTAQQEGIRYYYAKKLEIAKRELNDILTKKRMEVA